MLKHKGAACRAAGGGDGLPSSTARNFAKVLMPVAVLKRLTVVSGAALDVANLGALFLLHTGFPESLAELQSRLDRQLLDEDWFPWLLAASAFPVVGAAGAVGLWRWALWLYCLFLVPCIGAQWLGTHPSRR